MSTDFACTKAEKVVLNLSGCIKRGDSIKYIDVHSMQLDHCPGPWIKDLFFSVRTLFTKKYVGWAASGQNKLEACGFYNFVVAAPFSTNVSQKGILHVPQSDDGDEENVSMHNGRMRSKRKAQDALQENSRHYTNNYNKMVASLSTMADAISSDPNSWSNTKRNNVQSGSSAEYAKFYDMEELKMEHEQLLALNSTDKYTLWTLKLMERKLATIQEALLK
eukprot:IDg6970t1